MQLGSVYTSLIASQVYFIGLFPSLLGNESQGSYTSAHVFIKGFPTKGAVRPVGPVEVSTSCTSALLKTSPSGTSSR